MTKQIFDEIISIALYALERRDFRGLCLKSELGYYYSLGLLNIDKNYVYQMGVDDDEGPMPRWLSERKEKRWGIHKAAERKAFIEMLQQDRETKKKLLDAFKKYLKKDELIDPFVELTRDYNGYTHLDICSYHQMD